MPPSAFIVGLPLLMAALSGGAAGRDGTSTKEHRSIDPCKTWVEQTLHGVEKIPMMRRRDYIVDRLAEACEAIPLAIRRAAEPRPGVRRVDRLDRVKEAAQRIASQTCTPPGAARNASEVVASCPLGTKLTVASAALDDMSAADYFVLLIINRSLSQSGAYDESTEILLRDFSLSAALRGEQERHSRSRTDKSPR